MGHQTGWWPDYTQKCVSIVTHIGKINAGLDAGPQERYTLHVGTLHVFDFQQMRENENHAAERRSESSRGEPGLQQCWIERSVTGAVKTQNWSFVIHQLSFYELAI
jgi:hypothetical protein